LQDFPKQALYINYGARGAMDNDDPRLKNFWSKNPFSKSLLDFFSSETFLEDLQKFVMPVVPHERGYSDQRSWHYVNDWSKARGLHAGFFHFFPEFVDLLHRIVGFAKFLLNRLHLLTQQVLALVLAHLFLHLLVDFRAQLQNLEFLREFADQRFQPLAHAGGFY